MDLLMAPLYDDDASWWACSSWTSPTTDAAPTRPTRAILNKYAAQAGRAVMGEVARRRLEEAVRLATAARQIVRAVGSEMSVERIMEVCQPAITHGSGRGRHVDPDVRRGR